MVDQRRITLLQRFLKWEKEQPGTIYLTQPYPDGRVIDYSWAQVGAEARRVATYLRALELPMGSNIAILGRNSAHWIIADLSIMMAGHVSVPLYPTLSGESARYILDHCEAKLLFLGKLDGSADNWPMIEKLLPANLPLVGLPMTPRKDIPQWSDIVAQNTPLLHVHDPAPSELCTIAYTSGSTGVSKGVMHSYRSMIAAGDGMADAIGATRHDRMLSYLPLAHVAERAVVESTSLYFGFHVYFSNSLDTFVKDVQRARPTIFFSVPRLWTKFYQGVNEKLPLSKQKILFSLPIVAPFVKKKILRDLGLDQVRVAITGSAPVPPDLVRWYRNLGLELLDAYGMSENFAVSHISRPGAVRIGYVGSCGKGVEARIAANGELQVKSPGQMMGYYKLPEQTARDVLPDGFFCTGDRGEIDEWGRLRITGRVKELFKTARGKYVAPAPIENKLGNHPRLEAVCVTGPGQPQPFALIMLAADAQQSLINNAETSREIESELIDFLGQINATLEDHEKLAYVVVIRQPWTVESGFLTPTLKIKRDVIENHYLPRADGWNASGEKVIWDL